MKNRTIEEYIEVIYTLQKKGRHVRTNDVAHMLDVAPPSVTEMLQKLDNKNLVNYVPYHGVTLTKDGKKLAKELMRKHKTLAEFLVIIGVDEIIADKDACKIEHSVNKDTMKKLKKFVEFARLEDGCTRWLDHFKYFDETGDFVKCTPKTPSKCPVHGSKKSA